MTIGILSWGARKTLVNTLESYAKYGLDEMDPEKIIFFQEITEEDQVIAEKYGYKAIGNVTNIGIAHGYKSLVASATGDLFLFLENDWELIEDPKDVLYGAANILRNHAADVVRLRHRNNPGHPLWSRIYQGREMEGQNFLLDSVHWMEYPESLGPIHKDDGFYWTTAPFANWTNNPTMFRTDWLKEVIVPHMGVGDVEIDMQPWWREQKDIQVIQHEKGLFTHNRLDR